MVGFLRLVSSYMSLFFAVKYYLKFRLNFSVFKPEELDLLLDRSDLTWSKQRQLMEEKDREEGNRKKKAKLDSVSKKSVPVKTSIFKIIDTEGAANSLPSVNK